MFTVKTVKKDERRYYEDLLQYSQEHLMLYPYHLSDVVVKGLRVTPFIYYINMMSDIMSQERSYDSLPNFTAADCKCRFIPLLTYLEITVLLRRDTCSDCLFVMILMSFWIATLFNLSQFYEFQLKSTESKKF